MINKNKFNALCLEHNVTLKEVASIVDMKYQTLVLKLNGKYAFNSIELNKLKKMFNMNNDTFISIFFAK